MATILADSFDGAGGTLLQNHAPVTGTGTWVYYPALSSSPPETGRMQLMGNGTLQKINYWGGPAAYYYSEVMTAPYDFTVTMGWTDAYTNPGPIFRVNTTANSFYQLAYFGNGGIGRIGLRRYSGGVWTDLAGDYAVGVNDGSAITVTVKDKGTSVEIWLSTVTNAPVITLTPTITGSYVGVIDKGMGGGAWFESVNVSSVAVGPTSASIVGTGGAIVGGQTISNNGLYYLPDARRVVWKGNVGVQGGIPQRNQVFTTILPSGGNDTTAIQTALNNCPVGQVVLLAAGTFNVSAKITIRKGITMRGSGMGITIVKGMAGLTGNIAYIEPSTWYWDFSSPPAINLEAPYTKGQTVLKTVAPHLLNSGDLIRIDERNDPTGDPMITNYGVGSGQTIDWMGRNTGADNRNIGQYVKVVGILDAYTFQIEIPLYFTFKSTLVPQMQHIMQIVEGASFENLTFDNSVSGVSETIALCNVANSWLLNVETICTYMAGIRFWNDYRITVTGCKIHEPFPLSAAGSDGPSYGQARGYGIWLFDSSACLVENNEIYHQSLGVTHQAATSGNVTAYNYIHDLHCNLNSQPVALNFHGPHSTMNLLEGNYCDTAFMADGYWGSSSHNTVFRNRFINMNGYPVQPWTVFIDGEQTYYNIVGNELGVVGVEQYYDNGPTYDVHTIFNVDPTGDATVIRHANVCSVSPSGSPGSDEIAGESLTLPASLYLDAKPIWMGSTVAWPPIGPDTPVLVDGGGTPTTNPFSIGSGGAVVGGSADIVIPSYTFIGGTGGAIAGGTANTSGTNIGATDTPTWAIVGAVPETIFRANTMR